eukprot:997771-Prorocentrum_minimum.AAC.2
MGSFGVSRFDEDIQTPFVVHGKRWRRFGERVARGTWVCFINIIRELWKGLWGVESILAVIGIGGPVKRSNIINMGALYLVVRPQVLFSFVTSMFSGGNNDDDLPPPSNKDKFDDF